MRKKDDVRDFIKGLYIYICIYIYIYIYIYKEEEL